MTTALFSPQATVLVTGASRGIGAAFAERIAASGAHVVLTARSRDDLADVATRVDATGGRATIVASDLAQPDGAADLVDQLASQQLDVDVLINNAGYGLVGPFLDHEASDAEGMVLLNCVALTSLTRRLLPPMLERGRGGILNVASVAAFVPAPRFAVYAATKAYVLSFSEALHAELRDTGVRVSCLCPGPVRTGFADRAGMDERFFDGALPVDEVVEAGLEGLAAGRRRVVPGLLNKMQTVATRLVPTDLTLRATEAVMRRAG